MDILKRFARYILEDEICSLEDEISFVKEELIKYETILQKTIDSYEISSELEEYYNNKYPKIYTTYSKKFLNKYEKIDIRCFVGSNNNKKLPLISYKNEDDLAIEGLKWVVDNFNYESDISTVGLNEYWNFSFESILNEEGDCEDGAILLYDILRKNGIPEWKLRLTAGYAINPWSGKVGGHAYLTYYSEDYDKWIALDWCYFPNIDEMKDQPHYKDVSFYGDIWFSFNELYCWGKDKL